MDIKTRIAVITSICVCFIQHTDADYTIDSIRNQTHPNEFSFRITNMVRLCSRKHQKPSITTFVFNVWSQQVCYRRLPITDYPAEYNTLLQAARTCSNECPDVTLIFDSIICEGGAVLPESFSVNYKCTDNWPDELTLQRNTTTSTTTIRSSYQPTDMRFTYYTLEGYSTPTNNGFLTINIGSIQCSSPYYTILDSMTADYNNTVFCNSELFSIPQIQELLHRSVAGTVLVPQSSCDIGINVRTQHIKLIYHCSNQITTTPLSTTRTNPTISTKTLQEKTTPVINSTSNTLNVRETTSYSPDTDAISMYTLQIILGVTIPLIIVLFIIAIVICLHRNRKRNPLISQQTYQAAHDDIYSDASIVYGSSVAMNQDPYNMQGRIRRGLSFQGSLGSGVYSICNDPTTNLAVATGPPGTPSPIRSAVRQSLDYSTDFIPSRTPPDGVADSSSSSTHVYDNPIPITDTTPPVPKSRPSTGLSSSTSSSYQNSENSRPTKRNGAINKSTNNNSANRLSAPGYCHPDGAAEPLYASLRKSTPVADNNIYHELEPIVKLYSCPIYSSIEDELK